MDIIIFVVFVLLIVLLVFVGRNDRTKWNKVFNDTLKRYKFHPCSESQNHAEKTIKKLIQPNKTLDIQKSNKAVLSNKEIYFSMMYIGGPGIPTVIISDAFLFPMNLSTDRHFIFFMKFDHYQGLAYEKDMVTSTYSLVDDFTPDTLVEIEVPKRTELDNVLFVFGEKGSSLDGLYGSSLFNCLAEAGKYGFFALYYKEGMAALITLERYGKRHVSGINWKEQWSYIQELMRLSEKK